MKRLKLNKRGQLFDNLGALATGVAALAITLVVVFLILSQTADNSQVTADANASAAVTDLQNAADDIPDWVPLIIVAAVGALLLFMVRSFSGGRR